MEMAAEYEVDEIVVLTITYDFAARIRSFELLADVFHLHRAGEAAPSSAPTAT